MAETNQPDTLIDDLVTPETTSVSQFIPEDELSDENWEDLADDARNRMNLSNDYWADALIQLKETDESVMHFLYFLSPERACKDAPLSTRSKDFLQQKLQDVASWNLEKSRDLAMLSLLLQMQGGLTYDFSQQTDEYIDLIKDPNYKDQRIEFLAAAKICNPIKQLSTDHPSWEEVKKQAQEMFDTGNLYKILWIQTAFPGKIQELNGFAGLVAERERVFNAFKDDPAKYVIGIGWNAALAALLTCGGVDITEKGLRLLPYTPNSTISPPPQEYV